MILRESLLVMLAGVAIGIAAALGATRLIASQLYGVEPNDAATIAATVLILALVCAAAGYLPARRAARVAPTVALRYE
jgi:ABC-type antimicrobial peptide transport system permease subunit